MSNFISFTYPQYYVETSAKDDEPKQIDITITLIQQIIPKQRIKDIHVYMNDIYISAECINGGIYNAMNHHGNPTIELFYPEEAHMVFHKLSKALCEDVGEKDNSIICIYPSIETIKYLLYIKLGIDEETKNLSRDWIDSKIFIEHSASLRDKLNEFYKWREYNMDIQLLTKDNKTFEYIF